MTGQKWCEKIDNNILKTLTKCESRTETPVCTTSDDRRKLNKQEQQDQSTLLDSATGPVLSHDLLQKYLIGSHKSPEFPIGLESACTSSGYDLVGPCSSEAVIGQLQNISEFSRSNFSDCNEKQYSARDSQAFQFGNLIINKDPCKNLDDSEITTVLSNDALDHNDVNSSHFAVVECKSYLSNEHLGDKYVINIGGDGELLHEEVAATIKGDTVINKTCIHSNHSLSNKPVTDPNEKGRCLLFSHARHSTDEGKFSTPGRKLNNENKNTPLGLQHRSSNCELNGSTSEVIALKDKKGFEGSGLFKHDQSDLSSYFTAHKGSGVLKHEQSDLSSYYTARSDFGSELYGFSISSFVTCPEYLTLGPRSRFTKAKDILLKGRNYVKTKFDDYQKRFQSNNKSDSADKRKCSATCGFPCFFLGREASQFSLGIPECSHARGDNQTDSEEKEDNSNSNNGLSELKEEFFSCDNSNMSENPDLTENHVTTLEGSKTVFSSLHNGPDVKQSESCHKKEGENGGEEAAALQRETNDNIMTVNLKEESVRAKTEEAGTGSVATETKEEDPQDDLPVGTEAHTIMPDNDNSTLRSENDPEQKPTNKRLRWVSAMEKTQSSSLHSSTTSNSSVEQFLYEREMDPEKLLKNLGFGFSPDSDTSCGRIPDRFLLSPSSAGGIDLYQFVLQNPDLHHLLWMWEKTSEAQSGSGVSLNQSPGRKTDGWARQHPFSSVVHGMKFIQTAQAEAESHRPKETDINSNNVKDISKIPSVLDYPNRVYLASQGFYGKEYVDKDKLLQEKGKEETKSKPKAVTAAEKRKQFFQSSKSKNWSLTDEPEDDLTFSESSSGSIDRGLMLRSFSEGLSISSESSLEGGDSFHEEYRRSSISNLRKQYHETIRQSIDGEFPVFVGSNFKNSGASDSENEKDKIQSTGERRKKEVERLMASLEDDGDYFAQSRQSSLKETDLVKKRSQPSKDSTLTSPLSPKNFNFSFENDDKFSTGTSPTDLKHKQEISIIVEDETDSKSNETSEIGSESETEIENDMAISETEIIRDDRRDRLGLSPFALMKDRSDSSHTLVSQDSNFETDSVSGDLTPRPGDVSPGILENSDVFITEKQICGEDLSESTSSSGTLNTLITCDREQVERSRSPVHVSMTTTEPDLKADQLKPTLVYPPQESFELEEISSAENGVDETLSAYSRQTGRRGWIEKSASTHSDSSGFADLESAGEATPSSYDPQQDATIFYDGRQGAVNSRYDRKRATQALNLHDNRNTHDALHPLTVTKLRQTESSDKFHKNTVIRRDKNDNFHVCSISNKLSANDTDVPSLTSVAYTATNSKPEKKSLVYTVSVPYKGESSRSLSDLRLGSQGQRVVPKRTFLSTINVDVTVKGEKNGIEKQNVFTSKGPVDYRELDPCSKDLLSGTSEFSRTTDKHMSFDDLSNLKGFQKQSAGFVNNVPDRHSDDLLLSNRSRSHLVENGIALKHRLRHAKKSKEVLASAKQQMVDWLLSNQQEKMGLKGSPEFMKQYEHPLSMSTPSLKFKQPQSRQLLNNQKSFERHSLDSREQLNEDRDYVFTGQNKLAKSGLDSEETLHGDNSGSHYRQSHISSQNLFHYKPQRRDLEDFRCDDSVVSTDESVGVQKQSSLIGSSIGIAEEHLEYLKLARLVNGPSNLAVSGSHKMPLMNYTPTVPLKHWTDLKKAKHLEEETRLMQHAIQRYKMELTVMETMLFNTCQLAASELSDEERADIEELQCLWSEVRKELGKLEENLSNRLSSVLSGNENFSPLNAMEVIHSMIDLLREQLYQQQLCISRNVSYDEDDLDLHLQSSGSSIQSGSTALSEPALAELSQQITDIRDSVLRTQLQQQVDLNKSFSDLKEAVMAEVRSEVNSNTKWLHLQLQSKDNEIQRLRMEILLQNLRTGTTRKRQYFESDV